jgi:hypothetical protein
MAPGTRSSVKSVMLAHDLIADARAADLAAIAASRGLKLRRQGAELVGPCPQCSGQDRFALNLRKQVWRCRVCCPKGGDVIALVQHIDGCDFRKAIEWLIGETVTPERRSEHYGQASEGSTDHERRQHRKAAWLWSQRQPIDGSIAETYLRNRGITVPLPPTLGFLPARGGHAPSMIAAFGLVAEIEPGMLSSPDVIVANGAVHVTKLKPDGSGKADVEPNKIVLGRPLGHPIVLAPPNDLIAPQATQVRAFLGSRGDSMQAMAIIVGRIAVAGVIGLMVWTRFLLDQASAHATPAGIRSPRPRRSRDQLTLHAGR